MMEIKFNQFSIKEGRMKARMEIYNPANADSYQTTYENSVPVHEETRLAVQSLIFHVEKVSGCRFPELQVDGFFRQPSGDSELVTIYGNMRTDDGACPVSMAVRIHLGHDEYPYVDRLLEDISLCEREALLYIKQGKRLGIDRFITLNEGGLAA